MTTTLRRFSIDGMPTFNILHNTDGNDTIQTNENLADDHEDKDDHDDDHDDHDHRQHHKQSQKKEVLESFDFTDSESMMWRKHQYRRYYQSKGKFWTYSRVTLFWKWTLTVITGLLIAFTGAFVAVFTEVLTDWKLETCYKLMEENNGGAAFFAYQFISMFLVLCAGALCWREPAAAGSGIPEIKAFLNGVNLNNVVRMPVLVAKVLGMCFSCAAGLPLGKEGPMIHAGSIIGALVSQGPSFSFTGQYDTSWTIFQDFRNDHTKRDFVTFGASAGIAAAFRAPIGGILFSLEEGASFWSTNITFRAFICAVITHLTLGLVFPDQSVSSSGMFAFGQFDNLYDGRSNFQIYELPMFMAIGCLGGVLGAFFNHLNEQVSIYRKKKINPVKSKRLTELVLITLTMSFISFIFPLMWQVCQPLPDTESYDPPATKQELDLVDRLVRFQCGEGKYNQLASLYFTSGDMAMRQLFHFREVGHLGSDSFTTGPLILFFIPYFLMAAITAGVLAPAGLFVPTLLAGASLGRMIGHWMNLTFPGHVADSGTYALIGAAAVLGGMARMTIAGTIIILEACGNITYLLPLMITFAASRYSGNAINASMYDMQLHLKEMPFLEGSMHSLGMLNYHPISQITTRNAVTFREIEKISRIIEILTTTTHNGFPIVSENGRLRGLILRKTLCGLLKLKAYSTPASDNAKYNPVEGGSLKLDQAATVFYDTLERVYPNFPDAKSVRLSDKEMNFWLDMRAHMDPSPLSLNENTSIRRSYVIFRTMGLRHLIVVDGDLKVVGIITRSDMNEHHLHHYWQEERERMIKDLNIDTLPQAVVHELPQTRDRRDSGFSSLTEEYPEHEDPEIAKHEGEISDSPTIVLRKKISS